MDSSGFNTTSHLAFDDADPLAVGGATCDCYRLRRYGKWHFVKRLKPSLAVDPRYVEALRKEFEVGYRLDHPALARYVALGEDYILMEYVDGMPLDEFATSHPDFFADLTNVHQWVEQLLDAVRYLHHHQVLHLDLKPANILVTRIGHDVRLVDFGFCYTDARPDTIGLTTAWAAPEQLAGGILDERTDIYALGRVLKSLPLPTSYHAVVARCTASDPAARYQSVDEIFAALQPRRRRWWLPTTLATIVIVAVTTWALLTQASRNNHPAPQENLHSLEHLEHLDSLDTLALLEKPRIQATQTRPSDEVSRPAPNIQPLRCDLQAAIRPLFDRMLGQYRTAYYDQVEKQYLTDLRRFEDEARPLLSDIYKKHGARYDRTTIDQEWEQVVLSYTMPLQWQMHRNYPHHDEFYDTITFEFYKFEY